MNTCPASVTPTWPHTAGPEQTLGREARGAHLRLASCLVPFRSESWSACFLLIWVRASRTSTNLAHKSRFCLGPVQLPSWWPGEAQSRLGSLQGLEAQPRAPAASLPPLSQASVGCRGSHKPRPCEFFHGHVLLTGARQLIGKAKPCG